MTNSLTLPEVKVEKLFNVEISLGEELDIGNIGKGYMSVTQISGGFFYGDKINGKVLKFGADWGVECNGVNIIDSRYILQTEEGSYISVHTTGRLKISPENMNQINEGKTIAPNQYYFRENVFFETGDERYQWLNGIIAFSILGIKDGEKISGDVYFVK
jgi:hypothetical protein